MFELRFALRQLRAAPAFSLLSIVTLALGIAGSTAILSVYRQVILKPLAFPETDRLVRVWANDVPRNYVGPSISWTRYELLRDSLQLIEGLAASYATTKTLTGQGEPDSIPVLTVTGNFLRTLGVAPALGRDFTAEEAAKGGPKALLLTDRFWRSRFAANPEVLGGSLTLNGESFAIVGVLPESFGYPFDSSEVVIARPQDNAGVAEGQVYGGASYLALTARLRPGVTLEQAEPELVAASARYRETFASLGDAQVPTTYRLFTDELFGSSRPSFHLLLAAAGLLLVIAAVNVMHLHLGRLSAQQREVGVRLSLGASPARIVRELLAAALLQSLLAGVLGAALAFAAVRLFAATSADLLPRPPEGIPLDAAALGVVGILSVLCGLGIGLYPARKCSAVDLRTVLQTGGRNASGDRRSARTRQVLLAAEAGFSVLLLIAAALLLTSFLRLRSVPLGYDPERIFTARFTLGDTYRTTGQRVAFFDDLEARLRARPEFESVASVMISPLTTGQPVTPLAPVDRPLPPISERVLAGFRAVSEDYFATMRIALLQGRNFTPADREDSAPVAIINQRLARRLYGDRNPLGQQVVAGLNTDIRYEIVGVVTDIRVYGPTREPAEEVYFSNRQRGRPAMAIVARARHRDVPALAAFRAALKEVDPSLPLTNYDSLERLAEESTNLQRVVLRLALGFAALAVVLVMTGIFGVLSSLVSQRRREIGIRFVLGSTPRQIAGLVVGQGLRPVLLGLIAGLGAAVALSRLLASLLYATRPVEPAVYAAATAGFLAVAVLACLLPAWLAMRVQPVEVLRGD